VQKFGSLISILENVDVRLFITKSFLISATSGAAFLAVLASSMVL